MKMERPFVFINVALSADGKLAPANRKYIQFGSQRDKKHLFELRTEADAVMSGARTLDSSAVKLDAGGKQYRRRRLKLGREKEAVRVVVSGKGTIDPKAEIFRHRFSPIIVLTTERAGQRRLAKLRELADDVLVCGKRELDFEAGLRMLRREWKVKRLLCEGGGEINGALFKAGLVDEVHVTICPVVFGGRDAPTLADGKGFETLNAAAPLRLKSQRRVGDELFLVYDVRR